MGCHSLLQGIFLTQESNPGHLHWQADSLLTEPPGKPYIRVVVSNFLGTPQFIWGEWVSLTTNYASLFLTNTYASDFHLLPTKNRGGMAVAPEDKLLGIHPYMTASYIHSGLCYYSFQVPNISFNFSHCV